VISAAEMGATAAIQTAKLGAEAAIDVGKSIKSIAEVIPQAAAQVGGGSITSNFTSLDYFAAGSIVALITGGIVLTAL
jgi:hypothetical protein